MTSGSAEEILRAAIRDVPDFPKEGILFRDITPLLLDPVAHRLAVEMLAAPFRDDPPDQILAVESRGFIFGGTLSYLLGCGLVIARKPGKLPADTHQVTYDLEYGTDTLEVHSDAIEPGAKVLVVDDLLATGGYRQGSRRSGREARRRRARSHLPCRAHSSRRSSAARRRAGLQHSRVLRPAAVPQRVAVA